MGRDDREFVYIIGGPSSFSPSSSSSCSSPCSSLQAWKGLAGLSRTARPGSRAGESTIFVKNDAAVQARTLFLRPGGAWQACLGQPGRAPKMKHFFFGKISIEILM